MSQLILQQQHKGPSTWASLSLRANITLGLWKNAVMVQKRRKGERELFLWRRTNSRHCRENTSLTNHLRITHDITILLPVFSLKCLIFTRLTTLNGAFWVREEAAAWRCRCVGATQIARLYWCEDLSGNERKKQFPTGIIAASSPHLLRCPTCKLSNMYMQANTVWLLNNEMIASEIKSGFDDIYLSRTVGSCANRKQTSVFNCIIT